MMFLTNKLVQKCLNGIFLHAWCMVLFYIINARLHEDTKNRVVLGECAILTKYTLYSHHCFQILAEVFFTEKLCKCCSYKVLIKKMGLQIVFTSAHERLRR